MTEFNIEENMFHKPPMLLVDKILEESANRGKTSFKIKDDNIFIADNGVFARAALIEIAAQSFAAVDKFQKMRKNLKSSKGFLAVVRDFEFFSDAAAGDEIICEIEKTDEMANLHMIEAKLFANGKKLACGEIRIFEFTDALNLENKQ